MHVFYAIDGSAKHWAMLKKSISSLRRHNATVPIGVHSYAPPEIANKQRAELGQLPGVGFYEYLGSPAVHPTQLKWRALNWITGERTAIFVDCDTYFFGDVADLLHEHAKADFYAREEVGTEAHGKPYVLGQLPIAPQLDRSRFHQACTAYGSNADIVFNTGVMIFNHGSARRLAGKMDLLERIAQNFRDPRQRTYPSTNKHIVEEIAAAVAIGTAGVSTGLLDPKRAPFFVEYHDAPEPPPVVVHAWTLYYPYLLMMAEGSEAARALPGVWPRPPWGTSSVQ